MGNDRDLKFRGITGKVPGSLLGVGPRCWVPGTRSGGTSRSGVPKQYLLPDLSIEWVTEDQRSRGSRTSGPVSVVTPEQKNPGFHLPKSRGPSSTFNLES